MTTSAHTDTTGASSRRTSKGRILCVTDRRDGPGYDCTIYRDGISIDSATPRDLRGLMTVMARERWHRIDLMASTEPADGGDWPVAAMSLIQAR